MKIMQLPLDVQDGSYKMSQGGNCRPAQAKRRRAGNQKRHRISSLSILIPFIILVGLFQHAVSHRAKQRVQTLHIAQ